MTLTRNALPYAQTVKCHNIILNGHKDANIYLCVHLSTGILKDELF